MEYYEKCFHMSKAVGFTKRMASAGRSFAIAKCFYEGDSSLGAHLKARSRCRPWTHQKASIDPAGYKTKMISNVGIHSFQALQLHRTRIIFQLQSRGVDTGRKSLFDYLSGSGCSVVACLSLGCPPASRKPYPRHAHALDHKIAHLSST